RMGGREIPRADFVRKVGELVNYPPMTGAWTLDDDLA
ncbi:MAG: leucyl/phenylalanyl-tRNA--protein transferase, partial [Betaproteobacteria bacterium]|nr:leucyl/phenylalanyl-tRNA--protein transferase [Betaproteobacteria bacterium]